MTPALSSWIFFNSCEVPVILTLPMRRGAFEPPYILTCCSHHETHAARSDRDRMCTPAQLTGNYSWHSIPYCFSLEKIRSLEKCWWISHLPKSTILKTMQIKCSILYFYGGKETVVYLIITVFIQCICHISQGSFWLVKYREALSSDNPELLLPCILLHTLC